jgi:hypothetical protein
VETIVIVVHVLERHGKTGCGHIWAIFYVWKIEGRMACPLGQGLWGGFDWASITSERCINSQLHERWRYEEQYLC